MTQTKNIHVSHIKLLIYGEGGLGKTSLALTSFNPILFDFNNGVHRSAFPILPEETGGKTDKEKWLNVFKFLEKNKEKINSYNTIVIDTYGDVLELIMNYLFEIKPKLFLAPGKPTQNSWGEIKSESKRFMKTVLSFKKDIIIIAHTNYVKKNNSDDYKSYPDIVGGSKKIFETDFDLIGNITPDQDKRTICFNNTENSMGKNSIELPTYTIPDQHSDEYPTFLAELMEEVKKQFNLRLKQNANPLHIYRPLKLEISEAEQPHELDSILDKINEVKFKHIEKMLKRDLNLRAKELKIQYNSNLPGFEFVDQKLHKERKQSQQKNKAEQSAQEVVSEIKKNNQE